MFGHQHAFQAQPRWKASSWKPKGYFKTQRTTLAGLNGREMGLLTELQNRANVAQTRVRAFGVLVDLGVGGLVTSVYQLAQRLQWSCETVRKYLKALESKKVIRRELAPEGHMIYVCDLEDDAALRHSKPKYDHPRSFLSRSIDPNRSYKETRPDQSLVLLGENEKQKLRLLAQETAKRILIVDDTDWPHPMPPEEWYERFMGRKRGDHDEK